MFPIPGNSQMTASVEGQQKFCKPRANVEGRNGIFYVRYQEITDKRHRNTNGKTYTRSSIGLL